MSEPVSASMYDPIAVEVAYALPEKQRIEKLTVPKGTSALEAVERANLGRFFDELPEPSASFSYRAWRHLSRRPK